jgi:hypothetical protein
MIFEYLENGSADCPLIRIFGTSIHDFVRLREVFRFLGDHKDRSQLLENNAYFCFRALTNFSLSNLEDKGAAIENAMATWYLSRKNWSLVSLLVEPLIDAPEVEGSHQWLSGPYAASPLPHTGLPVVLSKSSTGTW